MDELQAVTRFATEYGIDFGVEHSVRFCAGEWFPQRQLLSFHAGDFSQAALGELLSALSLNDPSALLRFFPGSEYVHFAAEACASVTICKCYLELDTANASPNAECIRFLGWKWATGPTADSGHVLTQYRQQPVRSWQSVVDQIFVEVIIEVFDRLVLAELLLVGLELVFGLILELVVDFTLR